MLYCRIMFCDMHKKAKDDFWTRKFGGTMYKAILFDLDGTLTESGEGITQMCAVCTGKTRKTGRESEETGSIYRLRRLKNSL